MINFNADLRETHIIGEQTREYIIGQPAVKALSQHQIALAGISYAFPPFTFVRPKPTMSQLLVCLDGEGEVWVDGQWQICKPGMAYLTPSGAPHAYHALATQPEKAWKICWVMYTETHIGQGERPVIVSEQPILTEVEPYELALAIDGLYHEYIGSADDLIMQQWAQLLNIYAQRMIGRPRIDMRLQQLWKHVDARLAAHWDSEQLARLLGVSSEHMRRLCQRQYGHSPMKHVTIMRMQRAMALLASGSYRIEDVATYIGYENPFAFSTAFKRYTGISPSAYRNR